MATLSTTRFLKQTLFCYKFVTVTTVTTDAQCLISFSAENFNSQLHRNNIGLDSQYLHLNWMFEHFYYALNKAPNAFQ
ncbi:hypothetical protein T02_10061 [Trichinella nativa]|uniref:Uncharacterized protein n=1 Tax=Trichinella nativa TaxID=6335 RepID=A0A0V1LP95_9BILA|nr:hypothetical protein T02_10061 [Trichinella nativa]